ncbi:MAG: ABC transporter permease [Actinomycetes bacterium]
MTVPRETGAIHDIGYRRYDGQRLGAAYIGRSLWVHSLRGAFGLGRSARSKVMPLLLLGVMVVPALIIAAVATLGGADELPLEYASYAVNLQVVVTIFVGAQAPQSVSRDLRFRVVALYFSRPLSRHAYVHAKLLAMSAALFVLLAMPLLVLYVGALLAEMPFWSNTRDVALALAGAAVFAVVLAGVGLLIAAFTPRRGIGVAAVVAVLLVLAGVSATVQGIAQEGGNDVVAGWAGLISPYSLVDGVQVSVLGAESSTAAGPPGTTGGLGFVLATIGLFAVCYGLLLLRYRRVAVG